MSKENTPADARKARAARAAAEIRKAKVKNNSERNKKYAFGGVLFLLVVLIIGGAVATVLVNGPKQAKELVNPADTTADFGVVTTAADFGGEVKEDPVEVVLYEDLMCSHCRDFNSIFGEYLSGLVESGDITLEYRMVSFMDGGASPNRYSRRATAAAFCARETDDGNKAFAESLDYFYQNQPAGGQKGPENKELLLTVRDFAPDTEKDCVLNEKYVPFVEKATEAFNEHPEVSGTPSAYINGEKLSDPNLIQQELTTLLEK